MSVIIGLIIIIVIFVLIFISMYNSLIQLRNQVKNAWSQIDVQLKRRYDLIPNLLETVKGYAAHEKETFQNVVEARSKAMSANSIQEKSSAENAFSGAISKFLLVVENYPELKANENFLQLQAQLEGTENRISVERKKFNETVQGYNTTIRQFPGNIIAGFFGFVQKEYFKAMAGAENAPKVEF